MVRLAVWPEQPERYYLSDEQAKDAVPHCVRWWHGGVNSSTGSWPGIWLGSDNQGRHVATIEPLRSVGGLH